MRVPWEFEEPSCREVGNESFFPDPSRTPEVREAQSVCFSCIHRAECAEWAINNEAYGVWGGLSEYERRKIRQRKNITIRENFVA